MTYFGQEEKSEKSLSDKEQGKEKECLFYMKEDVKAAIKKLRDWGIKRFHSNHKPEDDLMIMMNKIKVIFGKELCSE